MLRDEHRLYINQSNQNGFEWVDLNHRDDCVMVYKRKGKKAVDDVLVILNLNPVPKKDWEVTVYKKYEEEIFNSDSKEFWGTGNYKNKTITCKLLDKEEGKYKLVVDLPPLSGIALK